MTTATTATRTTTTDFTTRGRELLELADSLDTSEAWKAGWTQPEHAFGTYEDECWRSATLYFVDDFEAEFGAWVEGLGFKPLAVMTAGAEVTEGQDRKYRSGYAMLGSPGNVVSISVAGASEEHPSTPVGAIDLEFMVTDLRAAFTAATERGIEVVREPWSDGMERAELRLPSGILLALWQIPREG